MKVIKLNECRYRKNYSKHQYRKANISAQDMFDTLNYASGPAGGEAGVRLREAFDRVTLRRAYQPQEALKEKRETMFASFLRRMFRWNDAWLMDVAEGHGHIGKYLKLKSEARHILLERWK